VAGQNFNLLACDDTSSLALVTVILAIYDLILSFFFSDFGKSFTTYKGIAVIPKIYQP
jgi:drug/metabolite transporter superfamily protein YnfA